jgi:hypothetical protein
VVLTDDEDFELPDGILSAEGIPKDEMTEPIAAPTPQGLKNSTTNALLSDPVPLMVSPTSFGKALDNLMGAPRPAPNQPALAPMPDGHTSHNPPRRTINPSELVSPTSSTGPKARRPRVARGAGAEI